MEEPKIDADAARVSLLLDQEIKKRVARALFEILLPEHRHMTATQVVIERFCEPGHEHKLADLFATFIADNLSTSPRFRDVLDRMP